MGGDNVLVGLIKNSSFYKKPLVLVVILLVIAGGFYAYWQSPLHAANIISTNQGVTNNAIDLTLSPDGGLYNGNVKLPAEVFTTDTTYRYRYQVINQPTDFIDQMQITISLPAAGTDSTIAHDFINNGGATAATSELLDPQTILYTATSISSQAQLSIEFEVPKGFVTPSLLFNLQQQLTALSPLVWASFSLGLLALTLIVLLIVGVSRARGTTPIGDQTENLPSRLQPALVGILLRGRLSSRDLAATFIDLAQRGHLVIRQFDLREFRFRRTVGRDQLADFEQVLLDQIFGPTNQSADSEEVSFSLAQEVFSKRVSESFILAYRKMNALGYFRTNPLALHMRYQVIAITLFVVGLLGFFVNAFLIPDIKYSLLLWGGMMGSALLIYYFSKGIPSRTIYGDRELARWLAFRRYMTDRAPINYVAQSQEKYLAYLPYAIVMDAETEWTWRFYNLPFAQPDWYIAPNIVTIDRFTNSLFPMFGYLSHALSLSAAPASR